MPNKITGGTANIADNLTKKSTDILQKDNKNILQADAQKFQQILSKDNSQQNQIIATNKKSNEALTLGDKVLHGMHNLGAKIESQANAVKLQVSSKDNMNMQSMFKTQFALANLMVTEDYVAKIVSKGTQAFDTLLKNQ